MGRKLNIVIIGLPLFSKRLAKQLKEYYREGNFISLDTYYNKFDKIIALWKIRRADVVFSINGSLQTSKIFDYTLKNNIPLIMNWVGSDVQIAADCVDKKDYREDYIQKAIHFCEVDWIKNELQEIGINAEICNFASFNKKYALKVPKTERIRVLSYIPEDRKEFYGIKDFISIAKANPEIDFMMVGCYAQEYIPFPSNLKSLGWKKNMDSTFDEVHICIRIPEHDGLSTFVLEALARGKQVIYKYNYPFVKSYESLDDISNILKEFNNDFISKKDLRNFEGMKYVSEQFSSEVILGNLIRIFTNLKNGKNVQ